MTQGLFPPPSASAGSGNATALNGIALGTTNATAGTFLGGNGTSIVSLLLSGDATTDGTGVLTLATVNAAPGTVGDATHTAQVTVDAKGRVTAATAVAITPGNLTGPITSVGLATSVASQTGTGSKFVMDTSPALVTPNIGTPSAGVLTNCTGTAAGLTAGNVTTNANLTGPITSAGNVTSVASQTGTGSTFVMQASPTLTTPNIGAATATALSTGTVTLADAANIVAGATTGTKIGTATTQKLGFYNATPIVQPTGDVIAALQNLGLGASLTVTATTNANLTGPITSVGNATSIASQTGTGTKFVVDNQPTVQGQTNADPSDNTKTQAWSLSGATTGTKLTMASSQTASRTATVPVLAGNDTFGMLGVAQTWSAQQTFGTALVSTLLSVTNSTDATTPTSGALRSAGGLGVAKRSFLGTIGSTFSGNVLAGVQDGTAVVAGQVGEVIESKISALTSAAATTAYLQLATVSLTAGDWLISASAIATPNGATFAVGAVLEALIGTTTASNTGTTTGYDRMIDGQPVVAGVNVSIAIPAKRVNISATTSYFLNVLQTYSAGTPQWQGSITATRIR